MLRGSLSIFGLMVLATGALILLVIAGAFGRLPGEADLQMIQNPMATEVYTADGVIMGKYYIQNRQYLEPGQISPTLKEALIATEDIRFYKHRGIDFRSLYRVLFKTLLLGKESSGGGSTLTQQLAKNLYPRRNFGPVSMPVNKVKEMVTARRIENIYSKEEILDLYLSTVPFGENTFGIKSASMRFFSKDPGNLTVEEAAVLVGMLKATSVYNPARNPEISRERRNVVIGQMVHYGYLESSRGDSLMELPLRLEYRPLPHNAGIAPYFREYIRKELDEWCRTHPGKDGEPRNLYTDGLKVYTTIDSRLQHYAEQAVREHMTSLQEIFMDQWKGHDLWKGISNEQLMINYDGKYRDEMAREEARNMNVFTWQGPQEKEYNTLDSIRHYLQFLQAGFLAMETGTGAIKAWVGGISYEHFKYDHVRTRRQVGSAFKPLVYLAALEKGISPCEFYPNDSVVYHEYEDWTPRNADRTYGGYYSLKGALIHSVNTVSVQLLMEAGIDTVVELAHKAGIVSPLPAVPSLALGTGNISLLEMTGVYQAIANRGRALEPLYISRIEDKDGQVLFEEKSSGKGTLICDPENAEILTEMLRRVVNEGTARGLRTRFGMTADVAGKTGTTQNYTDGWFIGYTPGLVAGAWVGGDLQNLRFRTMQYGQGAHSAMPIWAGFMSRTFHDIHWGYLENETFDISRDVRYRLACEDYREKKPLGLRTREFLKDKKFLKNLFRRKRKRNPRR